MLLIIIPLLSFLSLHTAELMPKIIFIQKAQVKFCNTAALSTVRNVDDIKQLAFTRVFVEQGLRPTNLYQDSDDRQKMMVKLARFLFLDKNPSTFFNSIEYKQYIASKENEDSLRRFCEDIQESIREKNKLAKTSRTASTFSEMNPVDWQKVSELDRKLRTQAQESIFHEWILYLYYPEITK